MILGIKYIFAYISSGISDLFSKKPIVCNFYFSKNQSLQPVYKIILETGIASNSDRSYFFSCLYISFVKMRIGIEYRELNI